MTGRTTTERILDAYLSPEADRLADRVIDAALDAIARTPQRRALRVPWRFPRMNTYTRLAGAAVLAVVALGGALYLLAPGNGVGPATPTATPAPVASPSLPPVSFTSPIYGYTVDRPGAWHVSPATTAWPVGGRLDTNPSWSDRIDSPVSLSPEFDWLIMAAQNLPRGMPGPTWETTYTQDVAASNRDCKGRPEEWRGDSMAGIEIYRLDLECEGLLLSDVVFVLDGKGYALSGNRGAIALFLQTFKAGG